MISTETMIETIVRRCLKRAQSKIYAFQMQYKDLLRDTHFNLWFCQGMSDELIVPFAEGNQCFGDVCKIDVVYDIDIYDAGVVEDLIRRFLSEMGIELSAK